MAISFGRALLAGASGVARYSEQERQRRQQRLDRVAELQDRLNLDIAKSEYAARYNRYEKNRNIKQQLGNTDPNSAAGQMIIGQALTGKSAQEVAILAQQGSRWQLEEVKEPTLTMPETSASQKAISPIQDWLNGYRGSQKPNERLAEYQRKIGSQFTPTSDQIPDERPATLGDTTSMTAPGQVPNVPPAGSIEPIGTTDATQAPETQPLSAQEPMTEDLPTQDFSAWIPKPKVDFDKLGEVKVKKDGKWVTKFVMHDKDGNIIEHDVDTGLDATKVDSTGATLKSLMLSKTMEQEASRGGKAGKSVTFQVGDSDEFVTKFFPNGESSLQRIDAIQVENEDGSVDHIDRFYNPEDETTSFGDIVRTKTKDPNEPVELVELQTMQDFTFAGDEDTGRSRGQFYSVFPESERESWDATIGKDKGFLGLVDSTPADFKATIAREFLQSKKAAVEAGLVTASDLTNTEFSKGWEDYWKAQAYIKSVGGVDNLVELLQDEDNEIPKEIFFGKIINVMPDTESLHRKLGITESTNPELYEDLTMKSRGSF